MKSRKKQSGMALFLGLMMLTSLTLVVLAAARGGRMELMMSGNQQESALAFNASEAGLIEGENFVEAAGSIQAFNDPQSGLLSSSDKDPDYLEPATWASSHAVRNSLPGAAETPKVIIKHLEDRSNNQAALVNIGGYGSMPPGKTVSYFRITARGTGYAPQSARQLQTHYGHAY